MMEMRAFLSWPNLSQRAIIDSFGGFTVNLVTFHALIACSRCELESMVRDKEMEMLQRTTTILDTVDALAKPASMKDLAKAHPNVTLHLLGIGEITRLLLRFLSLIHI